MSSRPPIIHNLDGVEFRLAEPADLSFIQQYGRVFRVFDDHDSGNISFGVDNGEQRRFIKLAGASTIDASVSPELAIEALRRAEQIHRDLAHPRIVQFIESIEHGPYFGLVFEWTNGELLRRINIESYAGFRSLPVDERLGAFDTVIDVMQHIHDSGYVAVDLYDASFLYDFDHKRITICDIDVFERKPMVNTMGRMWGSTRFMSPEEFELGEVIDEITNVYTLGAIAFLFFGDERDRQIELWDAGESRFETAKKATRDERDARFPRIAAFAQKWKQA